MLVKYPIIVILGLDPSICYLSRNNEMLGSSPSMTQVFLGVEITCKGIRSRPLQKYLKAV